MDFGGDEFTKQLMGSGVANLVFVCVFFLLKCCKERLKSSHCKSCCCEIDTELATIRRRDRDRDREDSVSSSTKEKHDHKRGEIQV